LETNASTVRGNGAAMPAGFVGGHEGATLAPANSEVTPQMPDLPGKMAHLA
jgi:hypothetical protein